MNQHEARLTESRPNRLPKFLREIETLGNEIGFLNAVHETLVHSNISVRVEGGFEQLREHTGGILFVGDHKNQWEFVAIMDMLSQMDRDDMFNIAKFYVKRQVHQALGHVASDLVAAVYPRVLASDRGEFFSSETFNRLVYRRFLLDTEESAAVNTSVLHTASSRLSDDGVVNIYPCGSIVDARTHPWRTGVGRIIQQLPEDARSDVLIAPYELERISKARLIGAVALRGRGIFGRPQTLTVQLGSIQTAEELVDTLPPLSRDDPVAITERLREQFLDTFQ